MSEQGEVRLVPVRQMRTGQLLVDGDDLSAIWDAGITEEEADTLSAGLGAIAGFRPTPAHHELIRKLESPFSKACL